MFLDRAIYTKGETPEPPKVGNNSECSSTEYNPFGVLTETAVGQKEMIDYMRKHEDSKIKSGKLHKIIIRINPRTARQQLT